MRFKLAKLPFVTHYNFSALDTEEKSSPASADFRYQLILDTIRCLKICLTHGLQWCLIMEEDSVVSSDFFESLDKFVILPYENRTNELSVISLYSYYTLVWGGPTRLVLPEYSMSNYPTDRAKLNSERMAMGLPPYSPQYNVSEKIYSSGAVVLILPLSVVKELVHYLETIGLKSDLDADVLMNREFPKFLKRPRRHVDPSLVNHIGFYSERMAQDQSRGNFSQLNTDSRFMFDPGE
jgi:hypothetical protein